MVPGPSARDAGGASNRRGRTKFCRSFCARTRRFTT